MKKIILIIMVLSLASIAYADDGIEDVQTIEDVHNLMLEQLSPYIGQSLGAVGKMYGNEAVNFYLLDKSLIGYVKTEGGKFAKFGKGKVKTPTMEVYIESIDVISELNSSPKKIDTFYKLKKAGKIKLQPIGFGKKTKYGFANTIGHIANMFV
ncbi:MAG: hypothetical protein PHO02_01005 [Candidatus Nanoarchaeia archaeon]|nr:hypothetical protein [Candidatus Nanoarchaeia archaeon]